MLTAADTGNRGVQGECEEQQAETGPVAGSGRDAVSSGCTGLVLCLYIAVLCTLPVFLWLFHIAANL